MTKPQRSKGMAAAREIMLTNGKLIGNMEQMTNRWKEEQEFLNCNSKEEEETSAEKQDEQETDLPSKEERFKVIGRPKTNTSAEENGIISEIEAISCRTAYGN
ncbi:hypothetical protein FQA39_LY05478 [Lamprigera yunnana]|nr:hypothetical protein FQA39_LY05478 [Lamprigera yunnana]